jgi:hypothetical protein
MANTAEKIAEITTIERTPQDAGWQSHIKCVFYDNGIVAVNGLPVNGGAAPPALAAGRVMLQMLEEMSKQIEAANRGG